MLYHLTANIETNHTIISVTYINAHIRFSHNQNTDHFQTNTGSY
jgi:hypothetical protein